MDSEFEEKYAVEVVCQNCKKPKTFYLDKGISVEDALNEVPCVFCECAVVIKKERR